MKFYPSLKLVRSDATIWEVASTRSLFSPTITTYIGLWIQKARAFARFGESKNSYSITFTLTIVKVKLTKLQILYLNLFKGAKLKKSSSKAKTQKSYIDYSFY